jgi:dihydrofolate reductase
MGKLIFSAITSLDGYIADEHGDFSWGEPDEQVHAFVNELERPIGTHLYGRRLYEVMAVWGTMTLDDLPPVMRDYALIWRAADTIVFSSTLEAVTTDRTRIERRFDVDEVRNLVHASSSDVAIGGPTLAARAFEGGLIDECQLLVAPVVVGGGTRALPDGVRLDLDLVSERRFDGGVVHLRYARRASAS